MTAVFSFRSDDFSVIVAFFRSSNSEKISRNQKLEKQRKIFQNYQNWNEISGVRLRRGH